VKKSNQLKELRKFNNSLQKVSWGNYQSFLRILLSSIELDEARHALSLLEKNAWSDLVEFADYLASTEYQTPAKHRLCNQVAAVIRKYPFPDGLLPYDPERKALDTFLACEHRCKRVNQRFTAFRKVRSPDEMALSYARSFIAHVLGDFNISDVFDNCSFGAGASLGIHGNATNSAQKILSKSWSVTPGAYYYSRAALKKDFYIFELLTGRKDAPFFSLDPEEFNRSFGEKARIVDYNNIAFVPKTVKVHRTIAVEPLLNGYLQKGVDVLMRKKLKRVGINLEDQEPNKEFARKGSLTYKASDAYCTIDLSSASDSVSIELCRNLLPPEWFEFLNAIRSHNYRLNGRVIPYHKFVTMGNGFCFPLETLIFASLCAASSTICRSKQDFLVYGDDLVVRKTVFPTLIKLLSLCGFKVNRDKTFFEGPFRESCGSDWFEGEDVRPIILDYRFDSLESIFKFCNMARSKDHCKMIFYESLEFLETLIPPILKFVRPYKGNADSCLEVPWDTFMASPYSRYHRKLQCWGWVELLTTPTPDERVKRFAGYHVALMRGAVTGVTSLTPFAERYSSRTKLCRRSYAGGYCIELPGSYFWDSMYYFLGR
jgi:hypothetical protein